MQKNVEEITKKLEEGVQNIFASDKYAEFLRVMTKFHNYSFNNCILISLQFPEATFVAGYKSWQNNFKRNVKKGEKAIRILAPMQKKFTKQIINEDGETEDKEIKYTTFRVTSVFDISQTEGEELPEICKELDGKVEGFEDLIEQLRKVSPVPIEYKKVAGSANGYYSHETKSIVVDESLSESQKVKTTIHEIAHAILHNEDNGIEKAADRRTKEVQAESVAYSVCNWLGLDTSEYSFGYVAEWSEGKELKELSKSMDVIRMTAAEIIDSLGLAV